MKKLSILTTPAVALGVGILCGAPQALAASYTLSQTNFDEAVGAAGNNKHGIFCDDSGAPMDPAFCTLSGGDWTQEGNVNLTWGLVLNNNVTITNTDNSTITGDITVNNVEATLEDLNMTGNLKVASEDAEVTIEGGSYTSNGMGGALNVDKAKSVSIKDATFTADGPSAAYIGDGDITITSGSFTSTGDNGIEFTGLDSVNISGGTFKGAASGITFAAAPAAGKVSISGGTFEGTAADGKAICVLGSTDETVISGMIANGYHFSNNTVKSSSDPFDNTYIAGTTKVLSDTSNEDSGSGETTTNTTTTTSTKKSSGIGAPDTGAPTAETNAKDNSNIFVIIATFVATMFGAIVLARKISKKA